MGLAPLLFCIVLRFGKKRDGSASKHGRFLHCTVCDFGSSYNPTLVVLLRHSTLLFASVRPSGTNPSTSWMSVHRSILLRNQSRDFPSGPVQISGNFSQNTRPICRIAVSLQIRLDTDSAQTQECQEEEEKERRPVPIQRIPRM